MTTDPGASSSEQPREGIGCLHTLEAREHADTPDAKQRGKRARRALAKTAERSPLTSPESDTPVGGEAPGSVVDVGFEIVRATAKLRLWLDKDPDKRRSQLHALWDVQRSAATLRNTLCRWYWQQDGAVLDAALQATGQAPKPWPEPAPPNGGVYQFGIGLVPTLGTGIVAQICREVRKKWLQERWDALVLAKRSPPHWLSDGPFPVRRQEARLTHCGGDEYSLSVALHSQQAAPQFSTRETFRIVAKDGFQREALQRLVAGVEAKQRAVTIGYDRRHRQWWVRIAYSRKIETPPVQPKKHAVIHRGMRYFLVGLTEDGQRWIYDGAAIEATLRRFQRRRRRRQHQYKASDRIGHGRSRSLQPIDHLEDKGERWRQTTTQTIARRYVGWLVKQGVTDLTIEDFTGIRDAREDFLEANSALKKSEIWERVQEWPYYQLQTRIVSCAEEVGIRVFQVSARWVSTTWPDTGEPAVPDYKTWVMRGPNGKKRHLDVAAAQNVLRRARGEVLREGEENVIKRLDAGGRAKKRGARKKGSKGAKPNRVLRER